MFFRSHHQQPGDIPENYFDDAVRRTLSIETLALKSILHNSFVGNELQTPKTLDEIYYSSINIDGLFFISYETQIINILRYQGIPITPNYSDLVTNSMLNAIYDWYRIELNTFTIIDPVLPSYVQPPRMHNSSPEVSAPAQASEPISPLTRKPQSKKARHTVSSKEKIDKLVLSSEITLVEGKEYHEVILPSIVTSDSKYKSEFLTSLFTTRLGKTIKKIKCGTKVYLYVATDQVKDFETLKKEIVEEPSHKTALEDRTLKPIAGHPNWYAYEVPENERPRRVASTFNKIATDTVLKLPKEYGVKRKTPPGLPWNNKEVEDLTYFFHYSKLGQQLIIASEATLNQTKANLKLKATQGTVILTEELNPVQAPPTVSIGSSIFTPPNDASLFSTDAELQLHNQGSPSL